MNVSCKINCCPFDDKCGNGLALSSKVFLGGNVRTSSLAVVASENLVAGEELGQYFGEIEHVRISRHERPRNNGYRLVMKTRPDLAPKLVRATINAEVMGGMMGFVKHFCRPVAEFREVANGRRTTVVVSTTDYISRGEEITANYGDDLWFVCCCGDDMCRHRDIQDQSDPWQMLASSKAVDSKGEAQELVLVILMAKDFGGRHRQPFIGFGANLVSSSHLDGIFGTWNPCHSLGLTFELRAPISRLAVSHYSAMQAPQWMVEAVAVYRLSLSDSPPSPHPTTSKPPHTTPSPTPTMVKLTGSPNYKMAEINRLVTLVYEHLPLGKDEWERLPSAYKTTRGQNWVECDLDSLRRKFKALYSARKPSGTAEMPPHIKNAKLAKQAIDDNANVVEMDDDADEDQEEDTEQGDEELFVELNFSFEPFLDDQGGDAQAGSDAAISNKSSCEDVRPADTASGDVLAIRSPLSVEATSSIDLRLGTEGLEAFAATPKPSPLPAVPAARQLRSTGLKKPRKAATPRATGLDPTTATKVAKMTKQPAARGFNPGSCDEQEAHRHASLQSVSNRVGGSNLYEFRDGVGAKRARDGEDLDQAEASFAKAKRIRATKTTAALKQKLADLESASSNLGNSPFAMMLLFREENERKSEARRVEEEQRSRDEAAAKEAQLLADKAEAEERRRQDKIEMDERVRRDKEDVRARTQEMMMFIGAIFKKA